MERQYTQVFIRPSTDVPWFNDTWPPSHMEYVQTNYKDTGKLTGSKTVSEDGLTMTTVHTFTDEVAEAEWMSDVYLQTMLQQRQEYNAINDIIELI